MCILNLLTFLSKVIWIEISEIVYPKLVLSILNDITDIMKLRVSNVHSIYINQQNIIIISHMFSIAFSQQ